MLYVFHVDTGTMMTFEMNLALESVRQLNDVIEKICKIPVDKQVLLVSGGECLDPSAKVCSYSAGTDTNPIFLFSKCTLENAKPPLSIEYGSDSDMKELVDNSLIMPATYNTIVKRTQIAQQFCELAREHTIVCESLVHDQHLQQQGWAAAVANLEDITTAFKAKSEIFEQSYKQYLENREENLKLLQTFSSDLKVLAKIPILDPLIGNALSFSTAEGRKKSEEAERKLKNSEEKKDDEDKENSEELRSMTLLMWISTADNQSSLEQVAEQAQRGLEQLDEKVLEALIKEVEAAIETADKCEMKEIKGLEERLFGLEQLMVETKKIVQEQSDLAQSLQQNQTRASSLNDPSVLPDLCASHRKQLLVMLHNQHMLRDIRRRCSKAKEELSINLYHRLGWVIYVENLIVEVSNKLMIYHENLKRLRKYLEITRQVQRTPQVYVAAVREVVRRKTFSQAFLLWASDLSCRVLEVYNEEYEKRKDFQSQFEGHFLQSLFPGFEDFPPPFATQAPAPFDASLPELTAKDIEQLQVHLPEFPMSLSVTKLSRIAQMLLTKSANHGELLSVEENDRAEERMVGLDSQSDKTLLEPTDQIADKKKSIQIKEDKEFESETDTEEFEKVCQSPMEGKTIDGPKFEENSGSTKSEVEALRLHLSEAGKLASETAVFLKTELVEMKSQSLTDKEKILNLVKDIQTRVTQLTQRYTEEVEDFHKNLEEVIESRDSEIESLKKSAEEKKKLLEIVTEDMNQTKSMLENTKMVNQELNDTLTVSQKLCEELKAKLEESVEEKNKTVRSITEEFNSKISEYDELLKKVKEESFKLVSEERGKLIHDHKNKMKELQLAISQYESASETEKEKAARDVKEMHGEELGKKLEELRAELTQKAEVERQKAIEEVTERLTSKYKGEIESLRTRFKLMSAATNTERSPSDSSLEKIEKSDVIELVKHEAIVSLLKEMAESEKQQAIEEAVNAERDRLNSKLEEEKQIWLEQTINMALTKKNNEIHKLLSRQESLITECQRHRNTIKLLMNGDHIRSATCPGAGTLDPLMEKIELLEKEKMILANELEMRLQKSVVEMRHVSDMSSSFAVVPVTDISSRDVGTSPEAGVQLLESNSTSRGKGLKSTPLVQQGKISITSCSVGDAVLVVWNLEHANYTILQETSTLYFLHADCLDSLGLRPGSDGSPRRLYCTAEVVEKEYCHAKKAGNRYKVPKGTKFYRVKVRPVTLCRESMGKSGHHQSQSHLQPVQSEEISAGQGSPELAKSYGIQSLEGVLDSNPVSGGASEISET